MRTHFLFIPSPIPLQINRLLIHICTQWFFYLIVFVTSWIFVEGMIKKGAGPIRVCVMKSLIFIFLNIFFLNNIGNNKKRSWSCFFFQMIWSMIMTTKFDLMNWKIKSNFELFSLFFFLCFLRDYLLDLIQWSFIPFLCFVSSFWITEVNGFIID